MKKTIVNILLAVCVLGLGYACYESIHSDISFDEEKTMREKAVIGRLLQIRDAEESFMRSHGYYCGTIDSLIDFVKNDKTVKEIREEGVVSDDQYDQIASEISAEGNYSEDEIRALVKERAVKKGIIKADTVWQSAAEVLGISNADSLRFIPIGKAGAQVQLCKDERANEKTFEMETLVEVRVALDDYMDGISPKRIKNLKSSLKKLGRNRAEFQKKEEADGKITYYPSVEDDDEGEWYGLRIGDLNDASNKMAGNWE